MPIAVGPTTQAYQIQESGSNFDFVTDSTVGNNPHVVISTTLDQNDNQMPYASFTQWIAGAGIKGGASGLTYDVASLTEETTPTGTDLLILERGGVSHKVTQANLLAGISNSDLASSPTTTTVVITNTGGDDATIVSASGSQAGIVTSADYTRFDAYEDYYVDLGDLIGTPTIDARSKRVIKFRLQAAAGFVDPNITPPSRPGVITLLIDENSQTMDWGNVPFANGGMRPILGTGLNRVDLFWTGSNWQIEQEYTENRLRNYRPPEVISSDATAAFQAMVNKAFSSSQISEMKLEPRRYRIDGEITFPSVTASEVRTFVLDGQGAVLDFSNAPAAATLFKRVATDVSDSDTRFWVPTMRNFTAFGSGTQNLLQWHIGQQIHLEDIKFQNFDIGLEVLWCVQGSIVNCKATGCVRPFRAISGQALVGGTVTNSNSNLISFKGCNANMSSASAVGFYLSHVGAGSLKQCAVEGSQCNIGVHLEGDTGGTFSTGRDCVIDQLWGECASLASLVRIDLDKSNVKISDIRIQGNQDTALTGAYIDATGSRRCHFKISDTRWEELVGTSGDFFADDATTGQFRNFWKFLDNTIDSPNVITSVDKWAGGNRPIDYRDVDTFYYG